MEKESAVLVSDDTADGQIHGRNLENPLAAEQMGLIYVTRKDRMAIPTQLPQLMTSGRPSREWP